MLHDVPVPARSQVADNMRRVSIGTAQIIQGNALNLPLPDSSVDLICTSPPYFGLRSYQDTPQLCDRCKQLIGQLPPYGNDYGRNLKEAWPDWDAHVAEFHKPIHYAGQIGSEATPAEFLDALLAATREMVRVLKPSGSIFVNLGDKYAGSTIGGQTTSGLHSKDGTDPGSAERQQRRIAKIAGQRIQTDFGGIPTKSLMGIPWRYAIACIDQLGLILRAEIIWNKPNGLPESVTDRVRRSHEQWFHLVKQPRYYSAVDEIREPHLNTGGGRGQYDTSASAAMTGTGMPKHVSLAMTNGNPLGKLPGSVWTIPTQPLSVPPELGVDHFAAYPMEWPRRIIQGWTPNGICTACGEGRRPVTQVTRQKRSNTLNGYSIKNADERGLSQTSMLRSNEIPTTTITGYVCGCPTLDAPTTPSVILDPFGGTGTTALVAKALGRTGITIDLSADYCRLAEWRCNDPRQLADALQIEKPEPVHPDQLDLFSEPS